jgi:S-DNA-T family DNA segregation ATPase FtsK/SpoIIIE
MAKRQTSSPKNVPSFQPARGRSSWFWAVLCAVLAVLLVVSFIDYRPEQSIHQTSDPTDRNLVGRFGAEVSWYGFFLFGGAAWLIPLFLAWLAWLMLRGVRRFVLGRLAAMIVAVVSGSALLAMQTLYFAYRHIYTQGPGGALGELLFRKALFDSLGMFGSGLILGAVYLVCLLFILFRDVGHELHVFADAFRAWNKARLERRAERRELKRLAKEAKAKALAAAKASPPPEPRKLAVGRKSQDAKPLAVDDAAERTIAAPPPPAEKVKPQEPKLAAAAADAARAKSTAKPDTADARVALKIVTPEETRKARIDLPKSRGNYVFPPLDLLAEQVANASGADEEEHGRTAEALLRTLNEFGVEVTLGEIHIGPVITRYEIYPAPGVRVEKIANLDKNIALGLRAQSVRILAPVPGKGCVGVEVPNKKATPVGIRELIESEDWAAAKAEIPLALGRDVGGRPVIADLTRMPHLLLAGATGAGKTSTPSSPRCSTSPAPKTCASSWSIPRSSR